MKIIERYALSEFLKIFFMAIASFVAVFLMVEVFEGMDNLMKHHVPFTQGVRYFLYKVPFIAGQTAPIAALVATLLTLGILNKHGEITAVKAGGIRLIRAFLPLLLCGLALSLAVIIINESITPVALKKVEAFRAQWFNVRGGFGKNGVWLRAPGGLLNVRYADMREQRLEGLTLFMLEKPFIVTGRINAKNAVWVNGLWVAKDAEVWDFPAGGIAKRRGAFDMTLPDIPSPEDISVAEGLLKNMGFMELKRYIEGIEAEGYNASKYRIDLYAKLTFPLVCFIMVLIGIPFALKTGRHGGIASGVGLSVVIAFGFWVVFAISRSLGTNGVIPPLVAAVFPDALFFAAGALMIGYVRE
ncbi:MAG: LPS export ABC transporter permease LptG [Deltaproteobacteria bacterium]|nr:LPS export ABC transporter permease LptG [Deltaproteobacteria bacterium]